MKRPLLTITAALLVTSTSFGQKWIPETICSTDTIVVEPDSSWDPYPVKSVTSNQPPYKIVRCRTRSNIGCRLEVAVSSYYYGEKTATWLGQHGGPDFNFILAADHLNAGFRFKPWTIDPEKELVFDGQTLPTAAKLNNIRLDYYVGYSFDFEKLISVEPYAGYNRTLFYVINEDDLQKQFRLEKTGGLIIGTTLNKYIRIKEYEYLSIFGTAGYAFVNYRKVHPDLDNGYFEWNLGIAYKGFATKRFNRKVE